MRKLLLLVGIFIVLAYNAQARYYEKYTHYKQYPNTKHYYNLSEEKTKTYNEQKYVKNNTIHPYIGLNIGTTLTKFNKDPLINDKTLSDHNLIIAPSVGLRAKYLGVEAFYQYSENNKKNINEYAKSSIGFSSLGVDLIGYIPVNKELEILTSLGVVQYYFKAKGSLKYEDVYEKIQKDYDTNAIRYGLGIQHVLKENVSIRAMAHYIKMNDKDYIKNMIELSLGLRYMF